MSVDEHKRGLRRWLLCTTVQGDTPERAWGGGILWLNWQRRGDFQDLVRQTAAGLPEVPRLGWAHINAETADTHAAFVNMFFATPWLSFDAFIVEPNPGTTTAEAFSELRRRALEDFLHAQISERLRAEPDEPQPVRVWLDGPALGYGSRKASVSALEDHVLRPLFGRLRPEDKAIAHRTGVTPGLQLGGLLLSALVAAWQEAAVHAPRKLVQSAMANHLGWSDLRTVSRPEDTKFNVRLGAPQLRSRRATQLSLWGPMASTRAAAAF